MTQKPIVFRTTHTVQFSDLDSYGHVGTGRYGVFYVDHRMQGVRERIGWTAPKLAELPYAVWVRRLEIDFIRPLMPDQEFAITSFVREFRGPDAIIECTMTDPSGRRLSAAVMTATCVDKNTGRGKDWPEEDIALFYEADAS
ncbi:MAG: acyl-CoA thioesterase [Vicinamibacterales bacterium]